MDKKITIASIVMVSFLFIGAGCNSDQATKLNTDKKQIVKTAKQVNQQKNQHQKVKNKLQLANSTNIDKEIKQKLCDYLSKEKISQLNNIPIDKIKRASDQYKKKWGDNCTYTFSKGDQEVSLNTRLAVEVMQNNKKAEQVYSNLTEEKDEKSELEMAKQIDDQFKLIRNVGDQSAYSGDGTLVILENNALFAIKSAEGNHEDKTVKELRKTLAKNLEDSKEIYKSVIEEL